MAPTSPLRSVQAARRIGAAASWGPRHSCISMASPAFSQSKRAGFFNSFATGGGSFGSPPTLRYFDAKGAGEMTRYLFAIGEQEYVDHRYPFKMEGTFGSPDFKVTKAEFDEDKAVKKFPFEKVPVLETEGKTVAQSKAIERFVAKKLGLFGANELEGLEIDAICEQIRDIKDAWTRAKGHKMMPDMKDEKVSKSVDDFFQTELPKQFGFLETLVANSGFFVGESASLADITFYHFLSTGISPPFAEKVPGALSGYPKLKALKDKVGCIPSLKDWEAKRPATNF